MPVIRYRMLLTLVAASSLIAAHVGAQGTTPSPAPRAAPAPAAPTPPAAATDAATAAHRTSAPTDAYVYIGWPLDGATVSSNGFKVWFGTRNFGIAPAGVQKPNTGHHHLLIDVAVPPLDQPIPSDRNHLHFGLGQTETVVQLPPGTHTLQLLMGDADHVPHDPALLSRRITIHVRADRPPAATQ